MASVSAATVGASQVAAWEETSWWLTSEVWARRRAPDSEIVFFFSFLFVLHVGSEESMYIDLAYQCHTPWVLGL